MTKLIPPKCEFKEYYHEEHNVKRLDGYYWLKQKKNSKVKEYLKAENKYTDAVYKATGMDKLADKCYKEFLSRIQQTDQQVPTKYKDFEYFYKTKEGMNYNYYYRRRVSPEIGEEQLIIDLNQFVDKDDPDFYIDMGIYEYSPNNNYVAYGMDLDGEEKYTLSILDVTGPTPILKYDGILKDIYSDVEWSSDEKYLFYSRSDDAERPYQIWRHEIGTSSDNDYLLYQEDDEQFYLSIDKSGDERFIIVSSGSITSNEVYIIPADQPLTELQSIKERDQNELYSIEFHKNKMLLLSNRNDNKNFQLFCKNFNEIELLEKIKNNTKNSKSFLFEKEIGEDWNLIIKHDRSRLLEDLLTFDNHLVIEQRDSGSQKIQIIPINETNTIDMENSYFIEFPEKSYECTLYHNAEYFTDHVRYQYSSPITPKSTFNFNMNTRAATLVKQEPVLGNIDFSQYLVERLEVPVPSQNGEEVKVPVSLIRKKDLPLDGTAPCLLSAYGAYGLSEDAGFSYKVFSLLDRNFVYAIAHPRGGGENGRYWYEDGKLLNKKNTFNDFIAVTNYLIDNKYTSSSSLAIYGGSAGGLLVGAVINQAPSLFAVAVAAVPFVDTLTTLFDESLPLTAIEWEEWGNPNDIQHYEYLKSYSPYDNIKDQEYPHLLITAGLNDTRVGYQEPTKFCAKLRDIKKDDKMLLLKTNMNAGHFGTSGRYDSLKEDSQEYAFILHRLNVKE